jgi:hypothetical protein
MRGKATVVWGATAMALAASPALASAHTFRGTCDLLGGGPNIPPGSLVAAGYEFKSKGTCTGSLDGGPAKPHRVRNAVHAAGANVGALPVLDGATGSVTFLDGKRKHRKTIHFRLSQLTVGFLISGDRSGNAFGYGLPSDNRTRVQVQTLSQLSG